MSQDNQESKTLDTAISALGNEYSQHALEKVLQQLMAKFDAASSALDKDLTPPPEYKLMLLNLLLDKVDEIVSGFSVDKVKHVFLDLEPTVKIKYLDSHDRMRLYRALDELRDLPNLSKYEMELVIKGSMRVLRVSPKK